MRKQPAPTFDDYAAFIAVALVLAALYFGVPVLLAGLVK